MQTKRVLVQSFVAKDGLGNRYTISVYENQFAWNGTSGHGGVGGTRELFTADGDEVGYVSKGRYVLIVDGETIELTSDDPQAP